MTTEAIEATEANHTSAQVDSQEAKPIIEIQFEKYIPGQYQLDRYVEIIHSNDRFLQILKKHPDSKVTHENTIPNSVIEEDLDELDQEIEELIKQMEREERKSLDSLYV
ncbi:MAG: hypothetical protein ACTSRK_13910 [Promethearchaeota archaeon]